MRTFRNLIYTIITRQPNRVIKLVIRHRMVGPITTLSVRALRHNGHGHPNLNTTNQVRQRALQIHHRPRQRPQIHTFQPSNQRHFSIITSGPTLHHFTQRHTGLNQHHQANRMRRKFFTNTNLQTRTRQPDTSTNINVNLIATTFSTQ